MLPYFNNKYLKRRQLVAKKALLAALAVILMAQAPAIAEVGDLAYLTNSNRPIKVFIKGFANESGQDQILPDAFRKTFEDSVRNRKSVTFEIVNDPAVSDIQISGIIKKYRYLKDDPVNSYAGSWAMALDAIAVENYAEMAVEFTVTDTKSKKEVWKDTVLSYVEHSMTPEQSIPMVYEKISRVFLSRSFGKPKR